MQKIFIIEIILGIVILVSLLLPRLSLAPWVPMRKEDLERINKLAALKKGDVFIEIGFGDGRACRYIAKNNPEAKVIGIEISPLLFAFTWLKNIIWPLTNLQLKFGDALKKDLSKADVVYTFAMVHSINQKLKDKFTKELKVAAKILSYDCPIYDWKGTSKTHKPHKEAVPIYIYSI